MSFRDLVHELVELLGVVKQGALELIVGYVARPDPALQSPVNSRTALRRAFSNSVIADRKTRAGRRSTRLPSTQALRSEAHRQVLGRYQPRREASMRPQGMATSAATTKATTMTTPTVIARSASSGRMASRS